MYPIVVVCQWIRNLEGSVLTFSTERMHPIIASIDLPSTLRIQVINTGIKQRRKNVEDVGFTLHFGLGRTSASTDISPCCNDRYFCDCPLHYHSHSPKVIKDTIQGFMKSENSLRERERTWTDDRQTTVKYEVHHRVSILVSKMMLVPVGLRFL